MKVGDVIFRKDIPQFRFRIVAESKEFPDYWIIEPVEKYRGFGRWKERRIVAKNDERWEVERSE